MSFIRLIPVSFVLIALVSYMLLAKKWHGEEVGLFEKPLESGSQESQFESTAHWSQVTWEGELWKNNDTCVSCHPAQASEWKNSIHQLSFADPLFRQQAASQGGDFDCLGCHLSEPIFNYPLGTVPPHRKDKHIEGVNCLTCHVKGNQVMARRTNPQAPCRPVAHGAMSNSESCHGCHMAYGKMNTLHEYDEWLLRDERNKDVHCQDCHMPFSKRPAALGLTPSRGRHHGFEIRNNKELFNKYFEARIVRSSEKAYHLVLKNKGTAHFFPTGYTIKTVVITLETNLQDEENGPEILERIELRKATPFGGTNTQLKDFEARTYPLADLSQYSEIKLTCLHKPYILMFDSEVEPFYELKFNPQTLLIEDLK